MTDKEKVENLKTFDEGKYENLDLDRLIMYVMGQLDKLGADLSFENAVVAAFKLFPKKFSLLGFPSYPDSLRVYTCLWRCSTDKNKQWLGGKIRQGFILTDRSRKFIKETENLLSGISPKEKKASSQTRRKELLLAEIEKSSAYIKYLNGQGNLITEADLCFLLQGTLDSSREILRENFYTLKRYAEELENKDVLKLLSSLEERFKNFFNINLR